MCFVLLQEDSILYLKAKSKTTCISFVKLWITCTGRYYNYFSFVHHVMVYLLTFDSC